MRLRATRLSATGGHFRRTVIASWLKHAASLIRTAGRQSVIPALPIMDGKGHWWLDRNRTQPLDPTVDLEKPIEWIDDLTGNPVGWELGPNIAPNGEFESGTSSWGVTAANISIASVSGGISGNALRITAATGVAAYARCAITVASSRTFVVTAWVKQSVGTGRGRLMCYSGGFGLLGAGSLFTPTGAWQQLSVTVTTTDTTLRVYLLGGEASVGHQIDYDRVVVREMIRDESWLGAELYTAFTSMGTGWVDNGNGTYTATASNGMASQTSPSAPFTAGKRFMVIFEITNYSAGSVRAYVNSTGFGSSRSANGVYTECILASGNNPVGASFIGVNFSGTVRPISVREVPGNHLVSPSAGTGPRATARVNLLQRTEDLSNAAWVQAGGPVVTATTIQDTTGGSYKTIRLEGNSAFSSGAALVLSFDVKKELSETFFGGVAVVINGGVTSVLRIIYSAVAGSIDTGQSTAVTITSQTVADMGTVWRISVAFSSTGVGTTASCIAYGTFSTNGTTLNPGIGSVRTITKFDLRLAIHTGPAYPAYQRVGDGTAGVFDYDATGFPVWRRNDGTRAMMTLGTVDMSGTSQAALMSVVTKLSSAALYYIAEFGPSGSVNGAVSLYGDTSTLGNYGGRHRGTLDAAITSANGSYPAPSINAILGDGNITVDLCRLTVDGFERTVATDQGAGPMSAQRLNDMGRDVGGTPSLRFVGLSTPPALIDMSVIDLSLAQEMLREYAASVGHTY